MQIDIKSGELHVKGKKTAGWSWRRTLYTLCFFLFCLIDQRTKTANRLDGLFEMFRDLTGVGMALLILSHCHLSEIKERKLPYLIWTVLSVAGGVAALVWGSRNRPFMNAWVVIVLDVVLYGYILIHTFISVFLDKKVPKLNRKTSILWLIMMLLMIVSRSDYLWPACYLVMFGCFYLTDFTQEEQEDLIHGILNGIILAFFGFQMFCCVFRPYDVLRYTGMYNNSNLNTSFYLEVLAAVFCKILMVTRKNACLFWKVFYWLGAGVIYSFLIMAMGRTGWLLSFAMGLLFLCFWDGMQCRKKLIRNGLILILCIVLMFPVTFGMTRYLPAVFHHPIWFWGEWNEEKVHSWDPWDSEKYVEMDEVLGAALGRVGDLFVLKTQAAELDKNPVLTTEEGTNQFLVRSTIYRHYLENLNIMGHTQKDQGFQLTPEFWVHHAHNIYLQYGTDFGFVTMICFIVLAIASTAVLFKKALAEKTEKQVGYLFFLMIPLLFGLLEYSWGTGSIQILLLFVSWREVFCME